MTSLFGHSRLPRGEWLLIAALAVTGFVLIGICGIAVGMLLDPLMREFKWTNSATSGLATAYSLGALLLGPPAGVAVDRVGSRGVMTAGVVATAVGFFWLGRSHALGECYGAFTLIGAGYGSAFFVASTALIVKRLGAQKNLVMGIWLGAGAVGAAAFSLLTDWSIAEYGWRWTASAAAVLILAMAAAVVAFIPRPEMSVDDAFDAEQRTRRLPPMNLLWDGQFLLMTAASALAAFGISAIYFHSVPIFLKAGFSSQSAHAVFSAGWILSGVGSIVSAAICNRLGARIVLAGSLVLGAIGTIALTLMAVAEFATLAVVLFVVLWGATSNAIYQFLPLLVMERYGAVHLGALVGVQGALMGLAGSFAPMVTGTLYDSYSSYLPAILASTLATSLAFPLIAFLNRGTAADAGDPAVAIPDEQLRPSN